MADLYNRFAKSLSLKPHELKWLIGCVVVAVLLVFNTILGLNLWALLLLFILLGLCCYKLRRFFRE